MSIRCFPPGVKPGPGPLRVPSPSTLSGAFAMLLGQPNPLTHTGFGCPSGALVPQISPPQPVQPIPPIRPRRRGSAVTHRRAGGRGAGMRSLPHRAHLPGTTGAQPGRASGGCFLSPRGQRAPTSPSQPSRQPAVPHHPPSTTGNSRGSRNHGVEP